MRRILATLLAAPLLTALSGLPAHAEEGTGELSGVWFFDRNQDGQQQAEEPGATDTFPLEVRTADGAHVASTYTNQNGHYRLPDLAPGGYQIHFTGDGYVPTTPADVSVTVQPDTTATVNFGMRGGQISGRTWMDDSDGQQNGDFGPMPGREIRLEEGAEPVAVTDEQGRYVIHDLRVDEEYSVHFEPSGGYSFTQQHMGDPATDSDADFYGVAQVTIQTGPDGSVDANNIDAGYVMSA